MDTSFSLSFLMCGALEALTERRGVGHSLYSDPHSLLSQPSLAGTSCSLLQQKPSIFLTCAAVKPHRPLWDLGSCILGSKHRLATICPHCCFTLLDSHNCPRLSGYFGVQILSFDIGSPHWITEQHDLWDWASASLSGSCEVTSQCPYGSSPYGSSHYM